jgi:hypothetical protein
VKIATIPPILLGGPFKIEPLKRFNKAEATPSGVKCMNSPNEIGGMAIIHTHLKVRYFWGV